MYTQTKETQGKLTPDTALAILKEGNARFLNKQKADRDLLQQVQETKDGQAPFAAILSCMDSRTSSELIFDLGIGDIFSIRVAGNVLNEDILGSLEYATKAVGSKVVVVLGHTKCGAIAGACSNVELGSLTGLLNKIKPAIEKASSASDSAEGSSPEFVGKVTELNVQLTLERIRQESPIIADLEKEGSIKLVGGIYEVETGKVNFFEN